MDAVFQEIRNWLALSGFGQQFLALPYWTFVAALIALPIPFWFLRMLASLLPPRIVRATLVSIYSLVALTIVTAAYLHSKTAAGWSLLAFVLSVIPSAALMTPNRPSILLLRRFHTETKRTAISRLFDFLTMRGFDCVTLADSVVKGDRVTWNAPTTLVVGTVVLAIWVLGAVALLIAAFDPLYSLGFGPFAGITLAGAILWMVLVSTIGMGQVRSISSWIMDRFAPSRFASKLLSQSGRVVVPKRFRHAWQGGLTVLVTNDQDWRTIVGSLIETSRWICIDLYSPSDHVVEELGLISRLNCQDRVIWLVPDGEETISIESNAYSVLGQRFPGTPSVWFYPSDLNCLDDMAHKPIARLSVQFEKDLLR